MSPRDLVLALSVVVIWGLNFIAIKWAVADLPPLFVTGLRYVGAALPAVFFVRRPRVALTLLIGYGVALGVVKFGLLFTAIKWGMPAGLASLVLQTQAFFTVALAFLFLGERLTRLHYAGIALAIVGISTIAGGRLEGAGSALVPFAMTILAGLFWGISNIIVKRAGRIEMFSFVVWTSLVPPVPLFILSYLIEGPDTFGSFVSDVTWQGGLSLAYIVYGATLFGFGVWSVLLSRYQAGVVAPFSLLVPVVGLSAGYLIEGERISALEGLGSVLVMTGLAVAVFGPIVMARRSQRA